MKLTITLMSAAALMATAFVATASEADRRAAMKEVGKSAKAISQGADVAANAQKIADIAKQIPAVFETNEVSADSGALPAIWSNWDDFKAKGVKLEEAAMAVVAAANGGGDVAAAAKAMGGACGACHKSYKKPN